MESPISRLKEPPSPACILRIRPHILAMASPPQTATGSIPLQASFSTTRTVSRCSWKRPVIPHCALSRISLHGLSSTLTWDYSQRLAVLLPQPRILHAPLLLVMAVSWPAAWQTDVPAVVARFASQRLPRLINLTVTCAAMVALVGREPYCLLTIRFF
jgi:hypothetical protein